ncbi:NADH-quinone oxidoreductase subunit J [Desulfuromonas carbonis]|uniref:NADH-quinone oxidoreductase subunit J family protein n=1 Tax=Desulfuromonas sp. DDH964 TaxID=1823759 RepID=UPI00078B505F|nr:NADH-quinone oxidoreductase subunit J [Desulfuromonas sp. DDH964]AMV70883.1 NADH dehydrogenase I subunit J [Desulfuromonas sp. DDH964]
MEILFFYLVALVAVISGLLVVTCKNPVNSAISLVMTFVCLATFYVMLHAPFMAAIQIMVYAGAIIVLIIFVIMLLNIGTTSQRQTSHSKGFAAGAGVLMVIQFLYMLNHSDATGMPGEITKEVVARVGHTELIGKALFTDFLLPFEITSILLLVAIVGAVVLAKRNV